MWSEPNREWRVWHPDFLGDELDPDRASSPWAGHRDFVYDLIRWRQPEVTVELGTHFGCSFFAMVQALSDTGVAAQIHAIDTWQGDPHAGEYGEEVFEGFTGRLEALTRRDDAQSVAASVHRSMFLDALPTFQDGSIDLLHIDGYHSYDALREDFETWLPKLSPNGLVLLHDVAQDSGYGSAEYYAQAIASQYEGFAFRHNFGLGVVLPKGTTGWEFLLSEEFKRWHEIYPFMASSRLGKLIDRDLTRLVQEKDEGVRNQTRMIDDRDHAIDVQKELIAQLEEQRQACAEDLQTVAHQRDVLEQECHALEQERAALETQKDAAVLRVDELENSIRQQTKALTRTIQHRARNKFGRQNQ